MSNLHYIYHFFFFQDKDESGKRGGEVEVPLHEVVKGEVPAGSSHSLHDQL